MVANSKNVLVVDDDAAVRASLKFSLELEGFRVRLYDRAKSLLAEAKLPERGCLVIDYRMADIDGIELMERLRSRRVTLPAILISARVTKQLQMLARKSGFVAVLEKPLSGALLSDSIHTALASIG